MNTKPKFLKFQTKINTKKYKLKSIKKTLGIVHPEKSI